MRLRAAILLLFFLSGAAGLAYEVLWLRMLILVFGSTQLAVSTVLTAFMGGLALGSFVSGRAIGRRLDLDSLLKVYGVIEIGIGLYALTVPALFGALVPAYKAVADSVSPGFASSNMLKLALSLLVLILPTALMGATFPILSARVVAQAGAPGWSVGRLYAVNTLGAVAGVLATGFALIPVHGSRATLLVAAGTNIAVGAAALWLARGEARLERRLVLPEPMPYSTASIGAVRPMVWILLGSGFAAMVYEVAWSRILALIIGSSVYGFAIMLATFLTGLGAGAGAGAWLARRAADRWISRLLAALLAGAATAAFGTLLGFGELPYLYARLHHQLEGGSASTLAIQFLMASAVMLPPTLLMGAIFPLAVRLVSPEATRVGRSVGTLYAANTIGAIGGSLLAGFYLIPAAGLQNSVILAILLDLALALVLLVAGGAAIPFDSRLRSARYRLAVAMLIAALGAAFWVFRPAWDILIMNGGVYHYVSDMEESDLTPEGFLSYMKGNLETQYYEEGETTSVLVAREKSTGAIVLSVNGKIDASSVGDLPTQLLSGHLPMLLARGAARDVLVIGYASGITVGAVTRHLVDQVTAVEIEPAVLRASRYFDLFNHRPMEDRRVQIVRDDGRNFLLLGGRSYDVIISEPSNPWMKVASNLFTREFFELGGRRLSRGGIFAQWLQLYGMSPSDLRSMVRTFHDVFPHMLAFTTIRESDLVLLGSEAPLWFDLADMDSRMADPTVANDLARIRVTTPHDILSYFVFGDRETPGFTGEGPINTDDNALIEFSAPKSLHVETRGENALLVRIATVDPTEYVRGLDDPERIRKHRLALAEAFRRRGMNDRAIQTAPPEPPVPPPAPRVDSAGPGR